jgi:hypothetical protein
VVVEVEVVELLELPREMVFLVDLVVEVEPLFQLLDLLLGDLEQVILVVPRAPILQRMDGEMMVVEEITSPMDRAAVAVAVLVEMVVTLFRLTLEALVVLD